MNGNTHGNDYSFYEDDFGENENVINATLPKRASLQNDPNFAEQGDNAFVPSEFDISDRDNELTEGTDSSAKPHPVRQKSSHSRIDDDDDEPTLQTFNHKSDSETENPTNHSSVGMEQLRSTTLNSQLETLPKLQTAPISIGSPETSSRNKHKRHNRHQSSSDIPSLRSNSLDTAFDHPDLSLDLMSVQELAAALQDLSKNARFRSIRPPWRQPNSRPLPSDDAVCVEEMLREYNLITSVGQRSGKMNSNTGPTVVVRRPYHSTLNRWRQQERIQVENFGIANRLKNIRPSRGTSRDELLRQYKEYFVTPFTAQSMTPPSLSDAYDLDLYSLRSRTGSHSSATVASRPVSANPDRRSIIVSGRKSELNPKRTPVRSRPMTGLPSSGRSAIPSQLSAGKLSSRQGDRASLTTCNCISNDLNKGSSNSLRTAEVLESLNSVRRALYEQKQRDK